MSLPMYRLHQARRGRPARGPRDAAVVRSFAAAVVLASLPAGAAAPTQVLVDVADSHSFSRTNGVGPLAYLHAGLRWERGFESRTTMGYRSSGTRVFVEAGGGLLAAVPGGGDAGIGHPPGFHLAGGLVFKRTSAHPLTLSLRYVQALAKRDEATLVASRQSWGVLQVGWRSGR